MPLGEEEMYKFGRFVLNPVERVLSCDGTSVPLTPKAFDTLICLVRNQGHMVTKDELLRQVWPDTFVEEINLAVNISTIRKALGESPQECRFIATVPGHGYRFVAAVHNLPSHNGNASTSRPGDTAVVAPIKQNSLSLAILVAFALLVVVLSVGYFWSRERET